MEAKEDEKNSRLIVIGKQQVIFFGKVTSTELHSVKLILNSTSCKLRLLKGETHLMAQGGVHMSE